MHVPSATASVGCLPNRSVCLCCSPEAQECALCCNMSSFSLCGTCLVCDGGCWDVCIHFVEWRVVLSTITVWGLAVIV
jgi:hypothetical protein